jgi:hypothetical protein
MNVGALLTGLFLVLTMSQKAAKGGFRPAFLIGKRVTGSHLTNTRSGVITQKAILIDSKSHQMNDWKRPIFGPATSLFVGRSPSAGMLPPHA